MTDFPAFDPVPYPEFLEQTDVFDQFVEQTPEIDRFCSSSGWILPAHRALHPKSKPALFKSKAGYAALLRRKLVGVGRVWMPLEASWCLACPLLGPEPEPLIAGLDRLLTENEDAWDLFLLSGILEGGRLWRSALKIFGGQRQLFQGETRLRRHASLSGGLDGFMSRRTAKFRENIRRTLRRCKEEAVTFEFFDGRLELDQQRILFERLMAVEERGWKGRAGEGVNVGHMREFYRLILERLGPAGRLLMVFAQRGEADIGYAMGGLFGHTFRGFQFSFDTEVSHLGLGNAMQIRIIERISEQGIELYDLGMDMEYKRHWSEIGFETVGLIIKK